jgi:hypothetical protein
MSNEQQFFDLLNRHGVPFVVVGGHAVIMHGYRRSTEDIDVVWRRSRDAEEKLLAALTEAGAEFITNEIDPQTRIEKSKPVSLAFIRAEHLMMLWSKFGFIDLFDYIPGHPAENVDQLFATCETQGNLKYVSLEWLKKMKRVAGRTKDRADLEYFEGPPTNGNS